jgi:hypothetical protein
MYRQPLIFRCIKFETILKYGCQETIDVKISGKPDSIFLMTHQILTRFFIASLIILGEGVFTCEVNLRSDVSVATIGNTFLSLPTAFLDNPEAGSHHVLSLPYLTPASSPLTDKVLDTPAFLVPDAIAYSPSNPRAPPVPV